MHMKAYLMMLLRGTMALLVLELLGTQFSAKLNAARIYKDRIKPNWAADSSHLWYRNDLPEGAYEFVLVDLLKGIRKSAFDSQTLARTLSESELKGVKPERLPLEDLKFNVRQGKAYFRAKGRRFSWNYETNNLREVQADAILDKKTNEKSQGVEKEQGTRFYRPSRRNSPDGKWQAFIENYNLYVKSTSGDERHQLTKDGKAENAYHAPYWAPNSNNLVAFRVKPGEVGEVHMVESSPKNGGRAKLHTRRYALPGDPFPLYELNWFDLNSKAHKKPPVGIIDLHRPNLLWTENGRYFRYSKVDRGHQRFRFIEVDTFTGQYRNIVDEKSDTFIWTEHFIDLGVRLVTQLKKTQEIIYLSEMDGHRHIYLVDIATSKMKPITEGSFVVRYVDKIDEEKRQIWFRASGLNPDQDPYLIHYYRVNFDGSNFTALTQANGWHEISYSPDRKFIIDRYSRVDLAPIHELRRVSNGELICTLEKADISGLIAEGWEPPEVFTAKGRDGKTDIWGIVCRPKDFDPNKKYPVLESMYAGPHDSYTPKKFSAGRIFSNWTDLGFVVAKLDGMGTANRSKAFHDVCWKNLKDAGFPDRILWHKAYAKKNSWYDTSRVGIYGGSAGGQSSTGALLFHPEFYKAAVSSCGCHDNRMDKASWNEQWMGYPVGSQYAASSNIENAHLLQGRLMLIVGELDKNVPPESTYRLVDALIKANKDFDFVLIPGAGHGGDGRHGHRRRIEFFQKHLMGIDPQNHNLKP